MKGSTIIWIIVGILAIAGISYFIYEFYKKKEEEAKPANFGNVNTQDLVIEFPVMFGSKFPDAVKNVQRFLNKYFSVDFSDPAGSIPLLVDGEWGSKTEARWKKLNYKGSNLAIKSFLATGSPKGISKEFYQEILKEL